MRIPKDRRRRVELRRTARRLRGLSRHRAPRMSAEQQLSARVRRHLRAQARSGIDGAVLRSVGEVIDSHVTSMRADLLRRHTAEDARLGKAQAEIDGLITQYTHDSGGRSSRVAHLTYQLRAALRGVEDRDTPMPAGPNAVEENGYQHGKVGELAGRSIWGLAALYLVLGLAMVADLITFRQVAERVVNDTAVFPLVLALTVTTTYVAHRAGEALGRARQLRHALGGWTLSGVWLAMGVGAFLFRLLAPDPVSSAVATGYGTAATSSSTDGSPTLSAVLLLLLYLLTGAIALTAGYHRPRAEIAQYARTNRRLRWADRRLGYLLRDITEAQALSRGLDELRQARLKHYDVEIARCEAAGRRARADAALLTHRLRAGKGSRFWWISRYRTRAGTGTADEAAPAADEMAQAAALPE